MPSSDSKSAATIPLDEIRPASCQRPKGLAPYKPYSKTKSTVARILSLYDRMKAADALPLGPRQVGYRLKELFPGEYGKRDFVGLGEVVKRLVQAGEIPFAWVADASAATFPPGGFASLDDFVRTLPDRYLADRRVGQPVVVELVTEAKETLGLIRRVAAERGVLVYSGSGSAGPKLAHGVAQRALNRAVESRQSTLILGISDFDDAGIRNILRPHIEHLSAFLYGTAGNEQVLGRPNGRDELVEISETPAKASFQHLALTGEMALELVETDADRERISDYIDSGDDLWSRDLELIDGVQKVELEALDPVQLRQIVVDAVDAVLEPDALLAVGDREDLDRGVLAGLVAKLNGSGEN